MINLLPDTHKQEIRAGRTNVLLVRYIAIMGSAVVVLSGLLGGAFVVLSATNQNALNKVEQNKQRMASYDSVKLQADAFRSDLTTAKVVLEKQVSYSSLIYRIASIVPKNVVLDSLVLDPKSFGSKVTMDASAKSFEDATKLKEAFLRSDEIFSNVQYQALRQSEDTSSDSGSKYPIKVNLNVVINKGALK